MSNREKSERRDREEDPKTPIKSKSIVSNTPEKASNKRWNKYMQSKKKSWLFGSPEKKKSREHGITNSQTKHDFTNSQTKRIRYQTPKNPQKKKRVESNSTSNQTTFSPTSNQTTFSPTDAKLLNVWIQRFKNKTLYDFHD